MDAPDSSRPRIHHGRALSERLAATSSLGTLRSSFGDEMELVHAYIMNMGGYYLDFSEVNFFGVDISSINSLGSSRLSSTAVDYSGVYFSGNRADENPRSYREPKTFNLPAKVHSGPIANSSLTDNPNLPISKPENVIAKGTIADFSRTVSHDESSSSQATCFPDTLNILRNTRSRSASQANKSKDHGHAVPEDSIRQISTPKMTSFQVLNLSRFEHGGWALTALQLLRAKGFKLYDALPPVAPHELESLNKSDSLVKLLAMLQIGWLMIQLFVRYKNNIVSSQIEIATLAFSICSLLTYAILWNRPRGVTTRYRVKATKAPKLNEIMSLATFGPGYLWTCIVSTEKKTKFCI